MAKSSLLKPVQCLEPCSWKFGVSNPLVFYFENSFLFLGKNSPFFEKKIGDNLNSFGFF
jgi:hypothetical protein